MDRSLVVSAQHNDRQAFEALAARAYTRLYRIALGVLHDAPSAEDATQAALIAMWRYLPRLRDPGRFDGWSYRLVVRACYDEARRRPPWLPESAAVPERHPVAADDYLGIVRRDELERAFPRLSVEHRAVIVLRYMLDLPMEQIAEALDVSVGTVGSRLNRALQALRAILDADARPGTPAVGQKVRVR
jgi:RNA polymerase sigma-70 factor (ECF subfamily)